MLWVHARQIAPRWSALVVGGGVHRARVSVGSASESRENTDDDHTDSDKGDGSELSGVSLGGFVSSLRGFLCPFGSQQHPLRIVECPLELGDVRLGFLDRVTTHSWPLRRGLVLWSATGS